jgi:transposase-like protein
MKIVDLCRTHGISDVTFYKWRSKYGGLEVSEAKRLRALEAGGKTGNSNNCLLIRCWKTMQ